MRLIVKRYRLELILAVGFRVRSPRGAQFRRWAGTTLAEYPVKGFLLNDQRLKDAERTDYFDELLRRIRDIRSSENASTRSCATNCGFNTCPGRDRATSAALLGRGNPGRCGPCLTSFELGASHGFVWLLG